MVHRELRELAQAAQDLGDLAHDGIGALLASVVFGVIWSAFGPTAAFATGATLSLAATALLFIVVRR